MAFGRLITTRISILIGVHTIAHTRTLPFKFVFMFYLLLKRQSAPASRQLFRAMVSASLHLLRSYDDVQADFMRYAPESLS